MNIEQKIKQKITNHNWYLKNIDRARIRNAKWSKEHPLRNIPARYKKFNFIAKDYLKMFKKQKGKCLICKIEKERLHIDHCHTKLIIRGLLCSRCNQGLGYFKDDIKLLKSAIKYLEKHK